MAVGKVKGMKLIYAARPHGNWFMGLSFLVTRHWLHACVLIHQLHSVWGPRRDAYDVNGPRSVIRSPEGIREVQKERYDKTFTDDSSTLTDVVQFHDCFVASSSVDWRLPQPTLFTAGDASLDRHVLIRHGHLLRLIGCLAMEWWLHCFRPAYYNGLLTSVLTAANPASPARPVVALFAHGAMARSLLVTSVVGASAGGLVGGS
ncbi:hypothetical protein PG984_007823 [Apiospora sp. TS-2023a]